VNQTRLGVFLSFFLWCAGDAFAAEPLHALIVGGGPDVEMNGLQIESHVRFVLSLLPPETKRAVFFADGSASRATVSYEELDKFSDAQNAFDVLFPDYKLGPQMLTRAEKLGTPLDGSSSRATLHRAVGELASALGQKGGPVLFYFAGHGSPGGNKESDTQYDMWNNGGLSVHELSAELSRLPSTAPVVLVMAQCYSGGFANVIFRDGDPKSPLLPQDLAGFFASTKDREAAGCGAGTDETEYQDFSSYFFGALSGCNRLGKAVTGADFDGDGRVSFHEALCYALIHDPTIDTPTCTTDAFLARFAPGKSSEIYGTGFEKILAAASPAQHAALEELSAKLDLTGDGRLLAAHDRLTYSDPVARASQIQAYRVTQDKLGALRKSGLDRVFSRWPELRWRKSPKFRDTLDAAMKKTGEDASFCKNLIEARDAFDHADEAMDVEKAMLLRFTRLCESVVRARQMRESGNAAMKARFERLWNAEQRSLPLAHVPGVIGRNSPLP